MAPEPPTPPPPLSGQGILRSLRHRNFRLFFIGQGISLIGTWMQQVAMGWLVYQMSTAMVRGASPEEKNAEAAFRLGVVTFASQIPSFLLIPFIGVFLDHWNRHRVVITTQCLAMIQAAMLTALVFAGTVEYWHVIALSVFLGCVNAFDMPGRQAFLPEMLESKEDLSNAIALNSSLFNGARLVGPMLAGFLIALLGVATCFLLNTLSYVAVLIALLAMQIPRRDSARHRSRVIQGMKEGFFYAFGFPPIRAIIVLIAMLSFVAIPYTALMPIFADRLRTNGPFTLGFIADFFLLWDVDLDAELNQGEVIYALLLTSSGVGALTGAIYMASRPSVLGLGIRITAATLAFGIGLIAFSQSVALWLSMLLLVFMSLSIMITMAGCNTILQTIVEDDKRGRIMSIYTMAFMGMSPLGSFLVGWLASQIGTRRAVLLCGLGCVVVAVVFARRLGSLRARIRPIYIAKGILTPEAPDIEPTREMLLPEETELAQEGQAQEAGGERGIDK
jgi:MFS family permease